MEDQFGEVSRHAKKLWKKLPFDSGNYPYVCARVKAKKALLYPLEMYQKFLQMTVPQISRVLGEGEYREEIVALGAKYGGVDLIEMATRDNLAKVYTQILDFSEGELKQIVSEFIDRWDVYNIETILRGKLYGAESQEILEDIVPAGTFTLKFLRELVEKESVEDVIDALEGNVCHLALEKARTAYEKCGTTAPFENALLLSYYSVLIEEIQPATEPSKQFLRFIKMEIDIVNLRTLLRLVLSGTEIDEEVFVGGGLEMGCEELNELSKLDWDSLIPKLRKYSFYEMIAADLKTAKEKGLNVVMRALEQHVLKQATSYPNVDPRSILPVLDFMLAKKNEIDNIRIIARGKESNLDNETIKDLLIM
jgi:V/A-type H+-transporting ATPase subunit C